MQNLNLIDEYNLRGAAYWQIMRLFRANWLLVESKFEGKNKGGKYKMRMISNYG